MDWKNAKSQKYGFEFAYLPDDRFVGDHMTRDQYEPYESDLFLSFLKGDSVFFDVGANIGYHTLIAGTKILPTCGKIYSFEPNKENFALLEHNIHANQLIQATPMYCAVGEHPGLVHLFLSNENRGDHRVYSSKDEARDSQPIEMKTLDDVIQQENIRPTIIKIDTQGFDFFVLKGMETFLMTRHPLVLFLEFWDYGNSISGVNSEEFFTFLCTHFGTVQMIHEEERMTTPASIKAIHEECSKHGGIYHANLLCIR